MLMEGGTRSHNHHHHSSPLLFRPHLLALVSWLCYLIAIITLLLFTTGCRSNKTDESTNVSLHSLPGNLSEFYHQHHSSHPVKGGQVCVDGRNNFVLAESNKKYRKEAMIENFTGLLYYTDGKKPACANGRPTVLLPSIVKFLSGTLHVPSNSSYNLTRSGTMLMTVKSPSYDDALCLHGKSQYSLLPDMFCSFNLCEMIGVELCELLQQPGTHTIKELEEKVKFNSTLLLPEPPSLLGISLLDLFSGEFWFRFSLETEGRVILELDIPANEKYLQLGVHPPSKEDDDDGKDADIPLLG